jgi:hypothetical protein
VNTNQASELRDALAERCTDYAGIEVIHLGQFRVKVVATMFDGSHVTVVQCCDEGRDPIRWSRQIAEKLHTVFVV